MCLGELGLGGEIRGGKGSHLKAKEAHKMGFSTIIAPYSAVYGSKYRSKAKSLQNYRANNDIDNGIETSASGNIIDTCKYLKDALQLAFDEKDLSFLRLRKSRMQKQSSILNKGNSDDFGDTQNIIYDFEEEFDDQ